LRRFVVASLAVTAGVLVELVLPGRGVYHSGWYNVLLAALTIVAVAAGRYVMKGAKDLRARLAVPAALLGTVALGLAGVANGLFAPDNHGVVGAPGERVRVEELGTLAFPLASEDRAQAAAVTLERPLHVPLAIGESPSYSGAFVLRALTRDVVYVEVSDLRGNRLTVTQPNGSVFLSPVLLMAHTQTIAGMDLPFDSFNVPAAQRAVKAVMFTPAQAAVMLHGTAPPGAGAVLFAVDDENDRVIPHGIAVSAGGAPVRIDGLLLRGAITSYPEIEVASSPNISVVAIGSLLMLAGLAGLIGAYRPATTARTLRSTMLPSESSIPFDGNT
jgi:hypothetical protein